MTPSIIRNILSIVMLMSVLSTNVIAQTKYKTKLFTYGGYEYNIYNSPEILFDRDIDEYINKDALILSDYFIDLGYDTKFSKKKKGKYIFEIGSKLWNRRYFQYPNVNQTKLGVSSRYERFISRNMIVGMEYGFSWNDKLGTTISGDELLRSVKYIGNTPGIYFKVDNLNNFDLKLGSTYQIKKYYDDNSNTPLDHSNLRMRFDIEYSINKKNKIRLTANFTDRKYKYYTASDSLGSIKSGYPLRHYQYYSIGVNYSLKMFENFSVSPGFNYTKRDDLYNGYYSYTYLSPKLKMKYSDKRLLVYLNAAYKKYNYDVRYAYTIVENSDLLIYNYLKYDFKIQYEILKKVDLFLNIISDNRDSNSELDYAVTRRSYSTYEVLFGVNISLFD